jgi:hypothetical protein
MSITIRLPMHLFRGGRSSARDEPTPTGGRVHEPSKQKWSPERWLAVSADGTQWGFFSEPAIDHFVMAITAAEAEIWHGN